MVVSLLPLGLEGFLGEDLGFWKVYTCGDLGAGCISEGGRMWGLGFIWFIFLRLKAIWVQWTLIFIRKRLRLITILFLTLLFHLLFHFFPTRNDPTSRLQKLYPNLCLYFTLPINISSPFIDLLYSWAHCRFNFLLYHVLQDIGKIFRSILFWKGVDSFSKILDNRFILKVYFFHCGFCILCLVTFTIDHSCM